MTQRLFDQLPDEPYGECADCDLVIDTESTARQHMSDTVGSKGNSSHSIKVTNPTRPDRIRSALQTVVDDAINDAMEEIDRMVSRAHLTDEEVAEALRWWPDFHDTWTEWVEDSER